MDSEIIATLIHENEQGNIKNDTLNEENQALCQDVRTLSQEVQTLQKDNEALYFNYPSLFQMHVEDRLDGTFFEMLTLKRKIEKGEITPEQATQIVGTKLSQRFVPGLAPQDQPQAPSLSYAEYYRQTQ